MPDSIDIRNCSYITVVDTYTRDGKHLKSVAKTPGGDVVWDEGRIPSKDVCFLSFPECPWLRNPVALSYQLSNHVGFGPEQEIRVKNVEPV